MIRFVFDISTGGSGARATFSGSVFEGHSKQRSKVQWVICFDSLVEGCLELDREGPTHFIWTAALAVQPEMLQHKELREDQRFPQRKAVGLPGELAGSHSLRKGKATATQIMSAFCHPIAGLRLIPRHAPMCCRVIVAFWRFGPQLVGTVGQRPGHIVVASSFFCASAGTLNFLSAMVVGPQMLSTPICAKTVRQKIGFPRGCFIPIDFFTPAQRLPSGYRLDVLGRACVK